MHTSARHWLDYDPIALAALLLGLGIVDAGAELLKARGKPSPACPNFRRGFQFAPSNRDLWISHIRTRLHAFTHGTSYPSLHRRTSRDSRDTRLGDRYS
jgi:hypothetical protein